MHDSNEQIARIRAYLQRHRDTYDRDALRRQLLDDGYSAEEIDAAMAEVYGDERAATVSSSTMLALPAVIFGILVLNAGACIISALSDGLIPLNIGFAPLVTTLVLEGVVVALLWTRRPVLARSIMWGLIIWLILTVALIMFIMFQLSS